MSIEIERKFLVNGTAYRTQSFSHYNILQGYIAHENGRSVRIRITDTEAILTIKEIEYTFSGMQFREMQMVREL